MKLKKCIVFFLFSCTFAQASDSYSNAKESAREHRFSTSLPMQTLTSQHCDSMSRLRLDSQERQVNLDIANFITKARLERKDMLIICAEKLRVNRVNRDNLKFVCTKLALHLTESPEDDAVCEKIEAIRDRFYSLTGSFAYNINPVWWLYSDREIRREGAQMLKLIMACLRVEGQNGSVEALAVEASSPNEQYDDQD